MSVAMPESATPRRLPGALVGFCALLAGAGAIAFPVGLIADPKATWIAFHVNFLYFAGLSQGGLVLACALVIIGARWAGPVRHLAEGLAAWVPVTFALGCVGFFGREVIFAGWIDGAPPGKEPWLNPTRLYVTDLAIFLVLALLSVRFLRASFRPALYEAVRAGRSANGIVGRWIEGWRGDRAERVESERQLRTLAPIICLLYAFGYSVISVDHVMSLQPTWVSNIFGWYFGWGGFLTGVAATALIAVLLRRVPGWRSEITAARMHDLGKMIFAFSVFWMYLFFSQYLVIWFGNLPEETQFFQARLGSQFLQDTWFWVGSRLDEPYVKLSLVAWLGCWVIPFWVLLGARPKRSPAILGGVAAAVLIGFWLERNALIWPALVPEGDSAWLGPIQIGIAAGFAGAFALVYLAFSRAFPIPPLPRR